MRHLFLLERSFVPNRQLVPATTMGTDALREALREENRILEIQNELIKLFLDLPPSVGEPAADDAQSDGHDVATPQVRTLRAKTKRKRPARKPTNPTPCNYEMDSRAAFEKYGFSMPESARDALLLMICVLEKDLRRAARLAIMELLFPSHVDKDDALQKLHTFLEHQQATCYVDIMQMSLFKHLNALATVRHSHV